MNLLHLMQNVLQFEPQPNDWPWIGVNDIASEGTFVYESNKEAIKFAPWGPRQPDNAGNAEDCVHMFHSDASDWNDHQCTIQNRFLCETPET